MGYAKGDAVVVRSMGLAKVKRLGADGTMEVLMSHEGAEVLELTAPSVLKRVRPVVDRATAEKLIELLSKKEGKPDRRSWGEQYVELQRVLRATDAEPMAEWLQRLYRTSRPLPATVERVIFNFEDALLPELAQVLGRAVEPLRAQLRLGNPAFGPSGPGSAAPPAELPKKLPQGWRCLGTFRVFSAKLLAGEVTERDFEATFPGNSFHTNVTVQARNGDWFAMVKEDEWVGVFVHADAVQGFEKRLTAGSRDLGKVVISNGTLCVLDEELREDRSFQNAHGIAGNEPVAGRGFVVTVGADTALPVHGFFDGKDAIILAARANKETTRGS